MSNYKKSIEENRKDLIENYFNSLNLKEINLKKELNSIITIQKYIRRFLCRKRLLILKNCFLSFSSTFLFKSYCFFIVISFI